MVVEQNIGNQIFCPIDIGQDNKGFDMGIRNEGPGLSPVYIDYKNSPNLQDLYQKIFIQLNPKNEPGKNLEMVFLEISRHFKINRPSEVDSIIGRDDKTPISLDNFVGKEAGTCMHTTLTLCVILEKLGEEKVATGNPTLGYFDGDRFSHVWCEVDVEGKKLVLDAVSGFFGTEKDYDSEILMDLAEAAFA